MKRAQSRHTGIHNEKHKEVRTVRAHRDTLRETQQSAHSQGTQKYAQRNTTKCAQSRHTGICTKEHSKARTVKTQGKEFIQIQLH